jgi:Ni/Fe-hydrogenase 1 B-type cytochrome subunit
MSARIGRLREWIRRLTGAADGAYTEAENVAERETIERHGLGNRISHWLMVALFFVMLVTGLLMLTGAYGPLTTELWGGYYPVFGLHMWAAIIFLAVGFVLFPFFYNIVDGHSPMLTREDLRDLVAIGAAIVGVREYLGGYHRARRTWDDREGEWDAYHPAQKLFWWNQMILFAALTVTGFAMYETMAAAPPWWVSWLGAPAAWLPGELQFQLHIFLAFSLTGAVILHIYFAVLPSNWDILRSMVYGEVNAYVIRDNNEEATPDAGSEGEDVTASEPAGPPGQTDD